LTLGLNLAIAFIAANNIDGSSLVPLKMKADLLTRAEEVPQSVLAKRLFRHRVRGKYFELFKVQETMKTSLLTWKRKMLRTRKMLRARKMLQMRKVMMTKSRHCKTWIKKSSHGLQIN
jgi:hypothetical protein